MSGTNRLATVDSVIETVSVLQAAKKPMTMAELCAAVGVQKAAMTRYLAALVERGLVDVKPGPRPPFGQGLTYGWVT